MGEFTINYLQTHYKMAFRLSDDALAYMTKAMGDDAKFERTVDSCHAASHRLP